MVETWSKRSYFFLRPKHDKVIQNPGGQVPDTSPERGARYNIIYSPPQDHISISMFIHEESPKRMVFASSFQGILCKSRGSQPIIPKIGYVRGIGSFELKIKYSDHPTNFDLPTTPISKLSRNFTKLENRSPSFHSKLDVSALQNLRNSKARKFCPRRYPKSPRSLSNSNAR